MTSPKSGRRHTLQHDRVSPLESRHRSLTVCTHDGVGRGVRLNVLEGVLGVRGYDPRIDVRGVSLRMRQSRCRGC